jgi:LPXTG-motif cell wall-anchored protein
MRLGLKSLIVGMALVAASLFAFSGLAGAQDNPSVYVSPNTASKTPPLAPVALGATASKSQSSLAFTGGDAAGLALIGGVAVAAGVGVMVVRRRNVA